MTTFLYACSTHLPRVSPETHYTRLTTPHTHISVHTTTKHKKTYPNIPKQINPNIQTHHGQCKTVSETFKTEIVQRIGRNLTDIMILRLISTQPAWGYKIIKTMETTYQIKLGHGILYPLLSTLEKGGFIQSTQEKHKGRVRKTYRITPKGTQLIKTYHEILEQQITMEDFKGTQEK